MNTINSNDEKLKIIINNEWKLLKRIGNGSFGEIYSCINIITGQEAAAKLVKNKTKFIQQLQIERKALELLRDGEGIVKVFLGEKICIDNRFVALIMDHLGPSLEDLRIYCDGKFSLKTTIMLADQMIHRIEYLHSRYLIHRDIKPENFLMGIGKEFNIVYIIDFGLAKQYIHPKSKKHIPFREFRSLIGTAKYCSINAHCGYEQSRRDDLESLGYTLLYFLNGSLPWENIENLNKFERFHLIHHAKLNIKLERFCENIPVEFMTYISYCKGLKYQQHPNYDYLRQILRNLFEKFNLKYDFQFDWITKNSYNRIL